MGRTTRRSNKEGPKSKVKPSFKFCPETGDKIWITTVTVRDIKQAAKTGDTPNARKKQLARIPSKTERERRYEEAANALATREERCLPTYGGRQWRVLCRFTEPKNRKPPLFRWFRGQLELAILPHFLESVPEPLEQRGKAALEEKELCVPSTSLTERPITQLSTVAWNDDEYAIPNMSLKWLSPNYKAFNNRKSAQEHAAELMEHQLFLDKILLGYGARGQKLRPTKPTRADALKAGKLRFVRDGLWVVGQEEAWQAKRADELEKSDELTKTSPKRRTSPLQRFLLAKRDDYRAEKQREMDQNGETMVRYGLRDAETELRLVWKSLSKEEQAQWKVAPCDEEQPQNSFSYEENEQPPSRVEILDLCIFPRDGNIASCRVAEASLLKNRTPRTTIGARLGEGHPATVEGGNRRQIKAGTAVEFNRNSSAGGIITPGDSESEVESGEPGPTGSVALLSARNEGSKARCTRNTHASHSDLGAPKHKRRRPLSRCPPRRFGQSCHWRMSQDQMDLCYTAALEHFDKVMHTVKARALHSELADGFDVLRERGRGRYDMELPAFDTPEFSFLRDLHKAPWIPIVKQILGEDVVLIHKGVFISMPGADAQGYHQDGVHLTTKVQRPCHAVNVFVPLVDLSTRNGPTEFVVGSHILDNDGYDRSKIEVPMVPAGTPVIFDYRLGHRGLGNSSDTCRPIVYCTYAAAANGREFRDSVNFSRRRYHRIGDLVEKPLSRDERVKKRKLAQEERMLNDLVNKYEQSCKQSSVVPPPPRCL